FVGTAEKAAPGMWAAILVRKRDTAGKLLGSVEHSRAIVNLGAGLDTRVYRMAELASLPAWEVGQPENIAAKRASLESAFDEVPRHVTLVPIDFDSEALSDALARHGYVAGAETFFI